MNPTNPAILLLAMVAAARTAAVEAELPVALPPVPEPSAAWQTVWQAAEQGDPGVVVRIDPVPDAPGWLSEPDSRGSFGRLPATKPNPLPGRDGVFQKLTFSGTWLPRLGNDGLGISDLDFGLTLGFPFPTREAPLLVTPKFAVHYLDGPLAPDLPPRLYDSSVEFRWLRRVRPRLAAVVAVEPGVHGDLDVNDSDTFRILGKGLGIYDWSTTTQIVLGVVYLDRYDLPVLPVGGVIWKPDDTWRYDLVAPYPKIARRLFLPTGPSPVEYWAYIGGELGGGIWAISRASGTRDILTAWDYRILWGVERKMPAGSVSRVEIGYVFGRTFDFSSPTPDYRPDDTLMLRVGMSY